MYLNITIAMTPQKGDQAYRAYEKGKESILNGTDNPYRGKRYIGLSNWWIKGYLDATGER